MADDESFADFRVGAVEPPRKANMVSRIKEFQEVFPEAETHRLALQLLGSDWVYVAPDKKYKDCWVVYIRFGQHIENLFDITREIVAYYSPYEDLQIRTFDRLGEAVTTGTRTVTPDLRALYSRDPNNRKKIRDWTKGAVTTLPLDTSGISTVDAAADLFSTLAEYLSTRDLYYETLPVTGEDFFGRRIILLSLMRDIQEHRVCGVFGLRKSGKTSVVRQVMAALDESTEEWALAFVDLETLPSPPIDPVPLLIERISTSLMQAFKKLQLRTHEMRHLSKSSSLDDFAKAVKSCLADADRKSVRVLLALDEVEFMLPGDLSDMRRANVAQFLSILRSMVQEHSSFLVLFSGLTSSIVESGRLFSRPNPFYSWAKPYFIGPMPSDEANNLVETLGRRMAIEWSRDALRSIFSATDGHAFYTRTLASSVIEQLPPRKRLFRIDESFVTSTLPKWKRATAVRVREILETLETYYPDERTLLDIAIENQSDLTDIAMEHPTEVDHLISLGLISEDSQGNLNVGALAKLGPHRRTR